MTYRSEKKAAINAVPMYVEHRNHTENMPEGFMVIQDGENFSPMCHKTLDGTLGWFRFYQTRTAIRFNSLEEAQAFIIGFVGFLEWMGGLFAPTREAEQYNETLKNQVIYYTEVRDGSEHVARLLQACRAGVLLADPAEPTDIGCWYTFNEVRGIQRGRQHGWK